MCCRCMSHGVVALCLPASDRGAYGARRVLVRVEGSVACVGARPTCQRRRVRQCFGSVVTIAINGVNSRKKGTNNRKAVWFRLYTVSTTA